MKLILKKLLIITAAFFCICTGVSAAASAEAYTISTDLITAVPGDTVFIPVNLNKGLNIMGFKATVVYDDSVLSSPAVSKGSITSSGLFDNSIENADFGSFDVVWSNSEGNNDEGTLFVLEFKTDPSNLSDTTVNISFDNTSTFDELYSEIHLECNPVTVTFDTGQTAVTAYRKPTDSNDIITAVNSSLADLGLTSIKSTEGFEDAIVKKVNDNLYSLGSEEKAKYKDISEIKAAYSDAYVDLYKETALKEIDGTVIQKTIDNYLKEQGVSSVTQLQTAQKEELVHLIDETLSGYCSYLGCLEDNVDPETAVETINDLYRGAEEQLTAGKEISYDKSETQNTDEAGIAKYVLCTAAAGCICGLLFVIIKKFNRKRRMDK